MKCPKCETQMNDPDVSFGKPDDASRYNWCPNCGTIECEGSSYTPRLHISAEPIADK